jgi:hypothetical protein
MKNIKANSRFNSSHQNMISAVITFALSSANLAVTSTIAAFLAIINLLKTNLDQVIDLEGKVNNPVTGVGQQKEVYRNALVQMSSLIMQTVYAYAITMENPELAAKMKMTPSKLARMKDSTFTGTVQGSIDNVTAELDNLGEYNITEALVDSWSEALASFKGIVSQPKVVQDGLDVLRNKIQDLLRASIILLYNQADTIALQFKKENIDYYRGYRKARKLQPLVKHTKLRVLVTTELGVAVPHVKVQQDNSSNYIITDLNGQADLYIQVQQGQTVELNGVYSFTLTLDTMSLNTGDIQIKKGHTVTKNVVMNATNFVIPDVVEEKETADN